MRTFKSSLALRRAATLLIAALPALAGAEPICAYVTGEVGGQSFATPAVVIYVPSSSAEVQPVRVHVDETNQTILGYSLRVPGATWETDKKTVFVPGVDEQIPAIVATLPELGLETMTCLDAGVSTPAVPVYVPESVLTTPGGVIEVPRIELNLLGHPITTCGHAIELPSKTVIIPEQSATVPGVSAETPAQNILVEIDGTGDLSRHLPAP